LGMRVEINRLPLATNCTNYSSGVSKFSANGIPQNKARPPR
jgi:hypothetical protein